jgi:Fe-S cluster biosynthesis and repair protein YggX
LFIQFYFLSRKLCCFQDFIYTPFCINSYNCCTRSQYWSWATQNMMLINSHKCMCNNINGKNKLNVI